MLENAQFTNVENKSTSRAVALTLVLLRKQMDLEEGAHIVINEINLVTQTSRASERYFNIFVPRSFFISISKQNPLSASG